MIQHRRDPSGTAEDMWRVHPVVPIVQNGVKWAVKVDWAQFAAPSPDLVAQYERRKREVFNDRLNKAVATLGGPSTPRIPVSPPREAEDLEGMM
jgi:hypothetical protein